MFGTAGLTLAGGVIAGASILFIVGTTAGIALGWGVYRACQWADHKFNNVETESLEDIASKMGKLGLSIARFQRLIFLMAMS